MPTPEPAAANPAAEVATATQAYRIEPPFYPIVYVRGYAMSGGERDETFHDGYYGFAASSVRKRQGPPDPDRYLLADVFEGQLMRFVKDFGYADAINRGNRVDRPPKQTVFNPSRSLWISRFYDADVLGKELRGIEAHAADLLQLITQIIPAELKSCGMDLGPNDEDYRVILLAHSMGGLVCRTVLQNLMPAAQLDPTRWVHRLVTMATPHGGIDLGSLPDGVEQWLVRTLNPNDASIFEARRMRQYLKLPDNLPPYHLNGSFPAKHCLCLIGSNYNDYAVGGNLVRRATGSFSDGLVKQNNAYLVEGPPPAADGSYPAAQRAFSANVHKSHSGYEGIVNSYESWENVHRFLFGDVRADISLDNLVLATAPPAQNETVFYDFEFSFSIRGTNTKTHWRAQFPCENAIRLKRDQVGTQPLLLHTAFLNTALRPVAPDDTDPADIDTADPSYPLSRYLHFLLTVRVVERRVKEASGLMHAFRHLVGVDSDYEGAAVYAETLEIRVDAVNYAVHYRWLSNTSQDWEKNATVTPRPEGGNIYRFPLRASGALKGDFVLQAEYWQPEVWAARQASKTA
ncbi:MAG: esterase/lipase family protein [Janthinobacterium lividum]